MRIAMQTQMVRQKQIMVAGTVNNAPTPPPEWQQPGTSPHDIVFTNMVEAASPSGPLLLQKVVVGDT